MPDTNSKTRWWMLVLLTATGTFVAGIQMSCMPPLFKEISDELGLSLVQIGSVWGLSSLAGIFVSILGGVLSDRFGAKRILTIFCILTGITGALRGVADSFAVLSLFVILNGAVRLIIPVSVTKTIGLWFRGPRLGMAMGVGAMGMGLGLMLGPLLSATVLSPWLGGWRNALFFLGGVSAFIGVLWWLFGREPPAAEPADEKPETISVRQAISELVRVRVIWIVGLTLLFRIGCLMGMNGYIPLYLRGQGWAPAAADATLSVFYAVSTLCVVPLTYLSDRLGSRLKVMIPATIVTIVCVGLIPLADGAGVWTLMIINGIFMDGFMALSTTVLMESKGVKPVYSGIALGMIFTIAQIGAVAAPPLGNALASVSAGTPFYFWAALAVVSLGVLTFYRKART
ncbi:MAG: MFS transporter [Dehalococcoidales bacterium]|nr:MFS transporter [Dehalococcoidales bacterium]